MVQETEQHRTIRERKRKHLETATIGDMEVTEERPAYRRLPADGDEAVTFNDQVPNRAHTVSADGGVGTVSVHRLNRHSEH